MINLIGSPETYLNKVDPNTVHQRPPRPKFEALDVNGDSSLDKTELQAMLDKLAEKTGATIDSEKVFSLVDTNKDLAIDKAEFHAGQRKVRDLMGPPPIRNHAKGGKKTGDFSDLILGLLNDNTSTTGSVSTVPDNADRLSNTLLSQYATDRISNTQYNSRFPLDMMA